MMFFVQYLNTYAPKNRAWLELTNYIAKFKYVLVKDELARTALVEELRNKVNEINKQYSKLKPFHFHAGVMGESLRVDVSVTKNGCPDMVFVMDIVKVRSIYQFSERIINNETTQNCLSHEQTENFVK
ncbi:hypothetical protein [Bacteroides caecimuris]|uniref:Uncharacterized protein n=1 Tax=Bacteroides caecimuris TaxID=1796613 RepID=A0A4S2DCD1_9BACE|nr:hypothetical protein [Bacteroides caecimuris]TGY38264.1 hypothetical protein E5353_07145 [Bacteroides caecimuris]